MSNYDINILKRNVSSLMEKNNISQTKLSDEIGMSQSNISKALSENDKKQFTLEQVFDIANFFNVSIDTLIGRSTSPRQRDKEISEFITFLFEHWPIKTTEIEIEEPLFEYEEYYGGFVHNRNVTSKYNALYFPRRYDPLMDYFYTDNRIDEPTYVSQAGNEVTSNQSINRYIEKYITIFELYKRGDLPKDAYDIVIEKYLEDMFYNVLSKDDLPF